MSHNPPFLLAGVMGWPVMHSRSPLMHNHWMQQHHMAGAYVPLAIAPEGLAAALQSLKPLGFAGCNLTIPHKQTAMLIVDEVDDAAQRIGAISCVTVRADGSLAGSNNDAAGFIRNLKEAQPDWRADKGPIVVIGAGGGSRAVCYGLMQEGAREIRLVNRHFERAEQLAADFGGPIQAYPWSQRHDILADAALVVNTTSQGMVGQTALDVQLHELPTSALVADIVYIPLETPFLTEARLRGNATVNGLGMLLHQGPLAWKAWCGMEPAVTPALRSLLENSITSALP
ncbi:shikimate dehydrogenase [Limnohabitans sp. 15K]|jgi:shikimate dehydrogenase|uniref:shikimate dehydrogenase n=1 Tax=Limnohabitans sp. 15K TaxID=1100706 RepID=UPI000C1F496C|nr:shikimate dehydrogenase [Limnohabitans sp. 15K]PIT83406.1 shikimate dehydrogenase [Limnohabitans sp. 15K]